MSSDMEQQQQPTTVMPPEQNYGGASASDGYSMWGWAKTPRGILRLVEFLFSIIIFGTMSSVNGFDQRSAYQFEVAVGVLLFIYLIVILATYVFRKNVDAFCLYQPIVELVFDGVFVILLLAAGAAAAAECNKKFCSDVQTGPTTFEEVCFSTCGDAPAGTAINNLKACFVFTFFTMILMAVSTYFSWKENAAEERKN